MADTLFESAQLHRILITGSEGLIGSALRTALEARGTEVAGLDLRGPGDEEGDVRDAERVRDAAAGCHGIVHLAAVSRVVWGERDPETCREVNVGGLRNIVAAASAARAETPAAGGEADAASEVRAPVRPCHEAGDGYEAGAASHADTEKSRKKADAGDARVLPAVPCFMAGARTVGWSSSRRTSLGSVTRSPASSGRIWWPGACCARTHRFRDGDPPVDARRLRNMLAHRIRVEREGIP